MVKKLILITWMVSVILGIIPSILSGRSFQFYDNSHVCIGLPLALSKRFVTKGETKMVYIYSIYKLYFKNYHDHYSTELEGNFNGQFFSSAIFLGVNFISYLTIVYCYIEIIRAYKKSAKNAGRPKDLQKELTLTAKVTAIVVTDFLCWFPVIILGILVQSRVVTLPPSVFAWSVTFILPINSAINPHLYTVAEIISKQKEKRAMKKIDVGPT